MQYVQLLNIVDTSIERLLISLQSTLCYSILRARFYPVQYFKEHLIFNKIHEKYLL